MEPPRIPSNETARLANLHQYQILDTVPEQDFLDLVTLASYICATPIALISFVDEKRQWFKANVGLDVTETSRDVSFCGYAILGKDIFMVPDAKQDARFHDNPLVEGDPEVRFYAGVPLESREGFNLGTLCVIDQEPRRLEQGELDALRALARLTVRLLERRPRE
jgi:GAF domain-containing protein